MFRTEILIDGELHRTVRGSRDEAIEFARQVVMDYVGSYVVTKAGPERDLTEALLDHDGCAWADVALPVTAVEYEKCPSCDVMGAWGRDYCEACGHEA